MTDQVTSERPRPGRTALIRAIAIIAVLALLAGSTVYWLHARRYESTDDAFIAGNSVRISPHISGTVEKLYVRDNEYVHEGDLLLEIDARDYQAAVDRAKAGLDMALAQRQQAKAQLALTKSTSEATIAAARAAVDAAKAEVDRTHADVARYRALYGNDEISKQQLDHTLAAADAADAGLARSRAELNKELTAPRKIAVKKAAVATAGARVEQAKAALERAKLDLSYTQIRAPHDGQIAKRAIDEGAFVQPSQALMALVYGPRWVVANFKETQLAHMRIGQPVEISIDAYPNETFDGRIDSVQGGTGAHFSLLPPENATGNYVKIVQRVPVKIVFTSPPDPRYPLALGLSVEPLVDIGPTAGEQDAALDGGNAAAKLRVQRAALTGASSAALGE